MRRALYSWLTATVVALGLAGIAAPAASADDSVTPLCNGQPCTGGWYTGPVFLSWSWSGGTATSGCSVQDYEGNTDQTLSCTVQFSDGSITRNYILKVEVDPPSAVGTLGRGTDSNDWYNQPVSVSFGGSAFSGIASCAPASTYDGPPGANITVNGSCTDNAGKTANTSISFRYDASPPIITGATASRPPDSNGYYTHAVTFHFTGVDAVSGIAGCDSITYSGPTSGAVVGGCRDLAGNYATISTPVKYRAPTPVASVARAGSSIVLHWKRAARARYYNVQIYRGGKKLLSSWPSHTSLLLRRSWLFAGHRFRLKPGRYRWYVWPGYGARAAAHYGRVIVSATFKVPKRG